MTNPGAQIYIVIFAGIFLMLIMVVFVVFMVLVHRQKQLKNRQELSLIKSEYEKTILNVEKEIQEQTLIYVGQELHDNIGQMLSLAKLFLSSSNPEQLVESKKLINQTIREVRSLSKTLNINWVEAISIKGFVEIELEKIEKTGFCKTSLAYNDELKELEKDKKIIVVRLIQETLNNSIKHAQPSLIKVDIHRNNKDIQLTIVDNGTGFDTNKKYEGIGVLNLNSRMQSVGGRTEISSIIGIGTEIKLILPL